MTETIDTAALAKLADVIAAKAAWREANGKASMNITLILAVPEARALAALLRGVVDGPKVAAGTFLVPANPTREQAIRFIESAARNVPFLGPWDDMVEDLKDGLRAISLPSPPLSTTKEG